jgi:sialidase-1
MSRTASLLFAVAAALIADSTAASPPTAAMSVAPSKSVHARRDPVLRLKLLPPGPDNPRNSEAAFIGLKDGRILMVYSHFPRKQGHDESPCYLAGRFSSDRGKTWTLDDVCIVSSDEARTGNVMSPSLLRLRDGSIALFYLRLNGPLDDRPIMRVSADEAQTWSEPRVCISGDEVGLYILNNDRAVQLKSGRLVLPLARHDDLTKPNQFNDYPRTRAFCFEVRFSG